MAQLDPLAQHNTLSPTTVYKHTYARTHTVKLTLLALVLVPQLLQLLLFLLLLLTSPLFHVKLKADETVIKVRVETGTSAALIWECVTYGDGKTWANECKRGMKVINTSSNV